MFMSITISYQEVDLGFVCTALSVPAVCVTMHRWNRRFLKSEQTLVQANKKIPCSKSQMGLGQWVWQSNLCALPPGQHASHLSTASVSVTDKVIYIHVVLYSLVPGLSVLTRKHKEACVCCRALVLIVLAAGTGSGFVWSRSPDWFIQVTWLVYPGHLTGLSRKIRICLE